MSLSMRLQSLIAHLPGGKTCPGVYGVFLLILIVLAIYWFALWTMCGYSGVNSCDMLNVNLFTTPFSNKPLSFWPISHFLLFFVLGLLFPHCDVLIISIGVLWEVFEVFMGKVLPNPRSHNATGENTQYGGNWWGGSIQDIVMDVAGFYTGKAFALNLPFLTRQTRKPSHIGNNSGSVPGQS